MAIPIFEFSFAKVGCGLEYFPINCKSWISFVELGISFAYFEWFFTDLEFSFMEVEYSFAYFPIICKCWI